MIGYMMEAKAAQRRRDRIKAATPEPEELRTKRLVIAEFNYMLNQAKVNDWAPKCEGQPERYVLYEATPTVDYAEALCDGCPMRTLCLEKATVNHEGWGVWGGVAFVDGKPFTRSARQQRMIAA